MFAQVIQGRTSDEAALHAALDRWMSDLRPGSIGWLGSTYGVSDDGRVVVVARFDSAEAAARNSQRPEQDRWWEGTSRHFDGEVTFLDSEDVSVELIGNPDQAGFVQIMQGQVSDPARAREVMDVFPLEAMKDFRPDILGSVMINHEHGRWTQAVYFTSEAEARAGEGKQPPQEWQDAMAEMDALAVGETDFIDLRRPVMRSA